MELSGMEWNGKEMKEELWKSILNRFNKFLN